MPSLYVILRMDASKKVSDGTFLLVILCPDDYQKKNAIDGVFYVDIPQGHHYIDVIEAIMLLTAKE